MVVHNAGAGWGAFARGQLLSGLKSAGYDATLAHPDRDLPRRLEKRCDVVVAAGGDGTVIGVARRLVHAKVPLVILPLGTANNLARTVGMEPSIERVVATLQAPVERGLDMGVATGSWGERFFCESAGVGWFCEALASRLDGSHKRSSRALEVLGEFLEQYQPRSWTVTLDGVDVSGEYLLVEVMNASGLGPNLELARGASPFDGEFDVVLLTEDHRRGLLTYLDARRHGQPVAPPRLPRRRAKHVQFELANQNLRIDDTVRPRNGAAASLFADLHIVPAAVRLWLPPTEP